MYASLPLSCPSRVVCDARRPPSRRRSRATRATPSAPTSTFCGDTSRWTMPSGSPRSVVASCAACRPCEHAAARSRTAIARRRRARRARARRASSRASDSPCTYSMTRKSSPSCATTSSVATTFGWWMRAASRASSRNIATNSGSFANCGWSRLIATVREKPHGPEQPPEVTRRHPAGRDLAVERVPPSLAGPLHRCSCESTPPGAAPRARSGATRRVAPRAGPSARCDAARRTPRAPGRRIGSYPDGRVARPSGTRLATR